MLYQGTPFSTYIVFGNFVVADPHIYISFSTVPVSAKRVTKLKFPQTKTPALRRG